VRQQYHNTACLEIDRWADKANNSVSGEPFDPFDFAQSKQAQGRLRSGQESGIQEKTIKTKFLTTTGYWLLATDY
jgi:hypothetical protein